MSAGNHAQGVAYHAQRLGLRAVIVMPRFTPGVKVERTRGFGAEVVLHGDTLDEARAHARMLAERAGPGVRAPLRRRGHRGRPGHGGAGDAAPQPDLDTLVIAIGGGGLIGGMAPRRRRPCGPASRSWACRPSAFRPCQRRQGHHLPQGSSTIAEGIAVGTPGVTAAEPSSATGSTTWLLVDEGDIEQAIVMLLEIEKTLVEGAGAAGLAAVLKHPERFVAARWGWCCAAATSTRCCWPRSSSAAWCAPGRLARIQVSARDVPGNLARITALVAEAGANIDEVHHQRAFTLLAAQNVEIELVLQTRGRDHVQQVIDALQAAGFRRAKDMTP
jgi:threonine dehydratase